MNEQNEDDLSREMSRINLLLDDIQTMVDDRLSMWEATFIEGMSKRLDEGSSLTPVQAGKIEEIHGKYIT